MNWKICDSDFMILVKMALFFAFSTGLLLLVLAVLIWVSRLLEVS